MKPNEQESMAAVNMGFDENVGGSAITVWCSLHCSCITTRQRFEPRTLPIPQTLSPTFGRQCKLETVV